MPVEMLSRHAIELSGWCVAHRVAIPVGQLQAGVVVVV